MNMLSGNYLQVVDNFGRLVTYNDDGSASTPNWFIYQSGYRIVRRQRHRVTRRAVLAASVGNLYNGSTASGVLSGSDAAMLALTATAPITQPAGHHGWNAGAGEHALQL